VATFIAATGRRHFERVTGTSTTDASLSALPNEAFQRPGVWKSSAVAGVGNRRLAQGCGSTETHVYSCHDQEEAGMFLAADPPESYREIPDKASWE
jgi:hypothetical protein